MDIIARTHPAAAARGAGSRGLLVAVAVIAALGMGYFALKTSRDQKDERIHGQVDNAVSLAGNAKTAVAEYFSNHEALPSDNGQAGLPESAAHAVDGTSNVAIASGVIIVTFTASAESSLANGKLVFVPHPDHATGMTSWDCTSQAGTTVALDLRPPSCRP